MNKEYSMAVALLQFKNAFNNLARASIALPDLDVTDSYPFYLLDYEEIAPAVSQWCSIHASKLMKQLPERVDNPACISCSFFRAGLNPSGICKGLEVVNCGLHPTIVYSPEAIVPYLISQEVDVTALSSEELHLLYIKKTEEVYEKKETERL